VAQAVARLVDQRKVDRRRFRDDGQPVETADIVVPAAHCEIVYEIPIKR
jgi:GntR family transcriptional regulator